MAEEAAAGGEGGGEGAPAATTATEESTDMGFYNRKLHNYPLIKVCAVRSMPMYMMYMYMYMLILNMCMGIVHTNGLTLSSIVL